MIKNDADLTITKLAPLIRRKAISPVELTQSILDRIFRLQPHVNAYITICAESALARAKKAEREIMRGQYKGFLHGIPVSLKDLFYTRGVTTTGGSKILRDFVPENDAPVVGRLMSAGCILLGKTNMHEFAFGATNINPHFGPVRNPWNLGRISGGSSGGSAASVVSAQSIASLGSDTGGSIRIPASACGCVGLKPTYGLISLEGVIPLAPSLDHVGPLCRCVCDSALLFEVIRNLSAPIPSLESVLKRLRRRVKFLKIGIPQNYFFDHIQFEVRQAVFAAIDVLRDLGAEIIEISLPDLQDTAQLAADITAAEASSYHDQWLKHRAQDYGNDVRCRLLKGSRLTAAAYIHALQKKADYAARMQGALNSLDLLLTPTLPLVAPPIFCHEGNNECGQDDIRTALLSLTRPANLSGLPAVTLPCGFSSDGLPIGLQLIGRRFDEFTILRAAYIYEQATPWHRKFPADPWNKNHR